MGVARGVKRVVTRERKWDQGEGGPPGGKLFSDLSFIYPKFFLINIQFIGSISLCSSIHDGSAQFKSSYSARSVLLGGSGGMPPQKNFQF